MTAIENLDYGVGLRRPVAVAEIDDVLTRTGLSACRSLQARVLSAGQKRRLAIARVMLAAAPLWILDEPFTNLDRAGVALLSGVIAEHLDHGGAAISRRINHQHLAAGDLSGTR
jgi:heme exporter protein A